MEEENWLPLGFLMLHGGIGDVIERFNICLIDDFIFFFLPRRLILSFSGARGGFTLAMRQDGSIFQMDKKKKYSCTGERFFLSGEDVWLSR